MNQSLRYSPNSGSKYQVCRITICLRWSCAIVALAIIGCDAPSSESKVLRLAVTTSTRDSGLLDTIVPNFEEAQAVRVDVIAVGTGAALKLGATGDVDALLCHSKDAELAFMAAGYGIRREPLMENSFILLGPSHDPGRVQGVTPADSFSLIQRSEQPFVSRGDDSGTHQCELRIWHKAGGLEQWNGYHETGQGMGQSLIVADQLQAYVLCDHGTYLKFRSKIGLVPLIPQGEGLENHYSAIVVNPNTNGQVNHLLAQSFVDYLISPSTQEQIGEYRIQGEQLFRPSRLAQVK